MKPLLRSNFVIIIIGRGGAYNRENKDVKGIESLPQTMNL